MDKGLQVDQKLKNEFSPSEFTGSHQFKIRI